MAYIYKENGEVKGPYPLHKGEYCGNDHEDFRLFDHMLNSNEKINNDNYRNKLRKGLPHSCEAGSSDEMAAKGFVGNYLKEDSTPMSWYEIVPTPPELMEPGKEHLYNLNGKIGLE